MTGTAENHPMPRLLTAVLLIAVLTVVAALPIVGAATLVTREASNTVNEDFRDIDANASLPLVSTVTDRDGNPLARLYDQRRYQVGSDEISQNVKDAVVSIEDRRFYDHDGVDVRGTLRALSLIHI